VKRPKYLSAAIRENVMRECREVGVSGARWTLKEIAGRHGISLSSVNKLIREAGIQGRPRRIQVLPSARVMKILREASEPGISYAQVGRQNPRIVRIGNRKVMRPTSRAWVSHLVRLWTQRLDSRKLHSKGFRPGDIIEWAKQRYVTVRYDSSHQGATIELDEAGHARLQTPDGRPIVSLLDGQKIAGLINPFVWKYQGKRSRLVEPTTEELTPQAVLKKYLEHVPSHQQT
jgi:hypothetical protein